MRVHTKIGVLAVAALVATAASASAQSRGARSSASMSEPRLMEFGVDAGLNFGLNDPKTTSVGLPVQSLRAAWYMSPTLAIEPSLALNYLKQDAGNGLSSSGTTMDLGVGALWHFSPDRSQRQFYARPFVDMLHVSFSDPGVPSQSATQMGMGAGLGVKVPFASRLSGRFEALFSHRLSTSQLPSQSNLGFSAGLSFYTR